MPRPDTRTETTAPAQGQASRQIALPSHMMPPRINEMERGHWHWRKKTQEFAEDLVAHILDEQFEFIVETGPIMLEVMVASRTDWDARLKSLCDGLQAAGIILDDAQIVEARVLKAPKNTVDQHHAVLIRWRPTEETTTEIIESWWGAPVKPRNAPKSTRRKAERR